MTMVFLYWVISAACWGYALRYGGWLSLWAFAMFAVGTAFTSFAVPARAGGIYWTGVNWPLLATDTAYFVGLSLLALFSRRYWPIWSAGLQLACVLTHFGPLLDHSSSPAIYRAMESIWILPMLGTMVIGIAKDYRHAKLEATYHERLGAHARARWPEP